MARDIATAFNNTYKTDALVLPKAEVQPESMTIPGTDGAKMSKSYGNFIDIYLEEKALRKVIMSIKTDSTPLEEPKDTQNDTTFKLYSLLSTEQESNELKALYEGGNFGYGAAKQMLYEKVTKVFFEPRKIYHELMAEPEKIDSILAIGAGKASEIAKNVLSRIKPLTGF
jgi:tryptophanyl-tRNA synthetase